MRPDFDAALPEVFEVFAEDFAEVLDFDADLREAFFDDFTLDGALVEVAGRIMSPAAGLTAPTASAAVSRAAFASPAACSPACPISLEAASTAPPKTPRATSSAPAPLFLLAIRNSYGELVTYLGVGGFQREDRAKATRCKDSRARVRDKLSRLGGIKKRMSRKRPDATVVTAAAEDARATGVVEESPDKAALRRQMEEARESISDTVAEIKSVVAHQYEEVRGTVETVRAEVGEVLDWRTEFERNPLVWGAGAVSIGILIGFGIARAFDDEDSGGRGRKKKQEASTGGHIVAELSGFADLVLPTISTKVKELFGLDLDAYLRAAHAERPARKPSSKKLTRKNKGSTKKRAVKKGAAKKSAAKSRRA